MNWSFFKSSKSLAPFLGQAYLGIIKIGRISFYLLNKVKDSGLLKRGKGNIYWFREEKNYGKYFYFFTSFSDPVASSSPRLFMSLFSSFFDFSQVGSLIENSPLISYFLAPIKSDGKV